MRKHMEVTQIIRACFVVWEDKNIQDHAFHFTLNGPTQVQEERGKMLRGIACMPQMYHVWPPCGTSDDRSDEWLSACQSWCMMKRIPRSQYGRGKTAGQRALLRKSTGIISQMDLQVRPLIENDQRSFYNFSVVFRHSLEHLLIQTSFQFGTWWGMTQTVIRHASVQQASSDSPHTVTQVLGVGSFENAPTFADIFLLVHTREQTNCSKSLSRPGSVAATATGSWFVKKLRSSAMGTTAPAKPHQGFTITSVRGKSENAVCLDRPG